LQGEFAGSVALLDEARQITTGIADMRSATRGVILFSLQHQDDLLAASRSSFASTAEAMRKAVTQMEAAGLGAEERAAVTPIRPALEQWVVNFQQFTELCAAGRAEEANRIARESTTPLMDALQKSARELHRLSGLHQESATRSANAAIERTELVDGLLTSLVLLAGVWSLLVVVGMVKDLKRIAHAVMGGAGQVTRAASQLSEASASLAQGSSEQAASLEETSASMEEIRSTVRSNAENSDASVAAVNTAGSMFVEANEALEVMETAIDEIGGSSNKISKIIKAIDEIAFQTNILALNAAVEAARAGEAGAGFAVVAEEVRNLAQRIATAARDTASLIEESMAKSNGGKSKVDRVAQAIHGVAGEAAKVKLLVEGVNVSSQQQMRRIDQVAIAVTQLEQITQKTSATAEESAAAAEQLKAQSDGMYGMASELAAMVGGQLGA
jgi:methyl-accepting chemotaxis protein/methyl-accepting chemotaxis protein-1 (serine sensor receptor)